MSSLIIIRPSSPSFCCSIKLHEVPEHGLEVHVGDRNRCMQYHDIAYHDISIEHMEYHAILRELQTSQHVQTECVQQEHLIGTRSFLSACLCFTFGTAPLTVLSRDSRSTCRTFDHRRVCALIGF
jgi:hypothetical protein